MAGDSSEHCANRGCKCRVAAGQTYCGPRCANAGVELAEKALEARCGCGHAGCSEEARTLLGASSAAVR